MNIEEINKTNFPQVAQIYAQGIATSIATFETVIPSWGEWNNSHLKFARIAAINHEKIVGWAALSAVSNRKVYRGVAEVSVYVNNKERGKGVGEFLLKNLIDGAEKNQIWTLQSAIFRENIASISLHEKCGFRTIGYREKVGYLRGMWFDNILMERRSLQVGI